MKGKPRNQKKGKTMNLLTHFNKTLMLPFIIALALVALVSPVVCAATL